MVSSADCPRWLVEVDDDGNVILSDHVEPAVRPRRLGRAIHVAVSDEADLGRIDTVGATVAPCGWDGRERPVVGVE